MYYDDHTAHNGPEGVELAEAFRPGLTGVPTFVVGDHPLTDLQDRETLEAVIERELVMGEGR